MRQICVKCGMGEWCDMPFSCYNLCDRCANIELKFKGYIDCYEFVTSLEKKQE